MKNAKSTSHYHKERFNARVVLSVAISTIVVAAFVTTIFIASTITGKAMAADHAEEQCFGYVQDKIKWNYNHDARWAPENVQQLCNGTTKYKEPGECFHRVMHGGTYGNDGIDWGKGTQWQWRNAVALCAGTDSAKTRISCFQGRVAEGEKWDAAIAQCLRLTTKDS